MARVIHFAYSTTESLKSWLNQLPKVLEIIARLQQNDDDNPPPVVPARYKEPDTIWVVKTRGPDVALHSGTRNDHQHHQPNMAIWFHLQVQSPYQLWGWPFWSKRTFLTMTYMSTEQNCEELFWLICIFGHTASFLDWDRHLLSTYHTCQGSSPLASAILVTSVLLLFVAAMLTLLQRRFGVVGCSAWRI